MRVGDRAAVGDTDLVGDERFLTLGSDLMDALLETAAALVMGDVGPVS